MIIPSTLGNLGIFNNCGWKKRMRDLNEALVWMWCRDGGFNVSTPTFLSDFHFRDFHYNSLSGTIPLTLGNREAFNICTRKKRTRDLRTALVLKWSRKRQFHKSSIFVIVTFLSRYLQSNLLTGYVPQFVCSSQSYTLICTTISFTALFHPVAPPKEMGTVSHALLPLLQLHPLMICFGISPCDAEEIGDFDLLRSSIWCLSFCLWMNKVFLPLCSSYPCGRERRRERDERKGSMYNGDVQLTLWPFSPLLFLQIHRDSLKQPLSLTLLRTRNLSCKLTLSLTLTHSLTHTHTSDTPTHSLYCKYTLLSLSHTLSNTNTRLPLSHTHALANTHTILSYATSSLRKAHRGRRTGWVTSAGPLYPHMEGSPPHTQSLSPLLCVCVCMCVWLRLRVCLSNIVCVCVRECVSNIGFVCERVCVCVCVCVWVCEWNCEWEKRGEREMNERQSVNKGVRERERERERAFTHTSRNVTLCKEDHRVVHVKSFPLYMYCVCACVCVCVRVC